MTIEARALYKKYINELHIPMLEHDCIEVFSSCIIASAIINAKDEIIQKLDSLENTIKGGLE